MSKKKIHFINKIKRMFNYIDIALDKIKIRDNIKVTDVLPPKRELASAAMLMSWQTHKPGSAGRRLFENGMRKVLQ